MLIRVRSTVLLAAVVALISSCGGCVALNRPAERVVVKPDAPASEPAAPAEDAAEKAEKLAEEQAADERKMAKHERDMAIAQERLAKARMDESHAEAQHADALTTAQRELELEQRRLQIFTERTAPKRIEQAKLALVRAEDGAKEAEEELKQLEMMYAEEDFADQTKEIVLERGRRRLARSLRGLELQREDLAILTDQTIPLETTEHETKVEGRIRAAEKTRRDANASKMDKHIAVMSAEAEIARLDTEIESLKEKMHKRQQDKAQASAQE